MKLQLYKMQMKESHFGRGRLEHVQFAANSQTIFSALFLEAMKYKREDELLDLAKSDEFVISNMLPYYCGLYLPKPIGYPKRVDSSPDDREKGKLLKRIKYVYSADMDAFIYGQIEDLESLLEEFNRSFERNIWTKKGEDPFRISSIRYSDDVYLAFIASANPLLEYLMESLQYSGIGGRRAIGFGQFNFSTEELDEEFLEKITNNSGKMSLLLSDSLPRDEDLDKALDGAQFVLEKKSGFAFSKETSENIRKNDVYMFKAGSTFANRFSGDVLDVAPDRFPHPVWSYAKPLFYCVE